MHGKSQISIATMSSILENRRCNSSKVALNNYRLCVIQQLSVSCEKLHPLYIVYLV